MRNGIIVGGGIFLVLLLFCGGIFFYLSKRDNIDVKNEVSLTIPQDADWCGKLKDSFATRRREVNPAGDKVLADDVAKTLSEAARGSIKEQKMTLSSLGVDILEGELCAYELVKISRWNKGGISKEEVPFVEKNDLEKYLSAERAEIVSEWVKKIALDELVKKEMDSANTAVLFCSDLNESRISEPLSGKRICEGSSNKKETASISDTWPDIEKFGGKWGGCSFQIVRGQSVVEKGGARVGGYVESIRYCATLATGTLATCTLSEGCVYSLPVKR